MDRYLYYKYTILLGATCALAHIGVHFTHRVFGLSVHLEQQLRMRQLAGERKKKVTNQIRSQVWQPYASMDYAQYGGTLYLSNHNFGWSYHPNTSWNTSYNTLQSPQVQRSRLEEVMDELRRTQAEFTMAQSEFLRSMAKMDHSQVGLPRFFDLNEISQPP